MRVLQLCKKFPYPVKDGESVAINVLSRSLVECGCELDLLAMNTSKHYVDISDPSANYEHYETVKTSKVDNRVTVSSAFLNLFSKTSYHIARFISKDFRNQLIQCLQKKSYDIVQLETLYLAPYIPWIRKYSSAKIVMRAHNVESEIWHRIADNTKHPLKKWYLKYLTRKLESFEMASLANYDLLLAISDKDLLQFRQWNYKGKAMVVPIGVDPSLYVPKEESFLAPLSISFIGSLDWVPNQEGLQWFLEYIWKVRPEKLQPIKLHIAGRNTPNWVRNIKLPNVFVHGEVPDAKAFLNEHSVSIVPLLSGSGMRAKILEAMALGKVVLTTTVGLEGIPAQDRSEILLADSPELCWQQLEFCLDHPQLLSQLGQNARAFVLNRYHNIQLAEQVISTYKGLR